MKKVFKVIYNAFCVLGCLLGAGFISGAEVITFFVRFEYWGIVGIFIASVLFGVVVYKNICNEKKNKTSIRFDFLPYCQTFIAGAMLSGIVDVVSQLLKINYYIVVLIVGLLLFISIYIGINFANAFNIVVSIVTLCILPFVIKYVGINDVHVDVSKGMLFGCVFAVLYVAMNSIACMPIIKNIKVSDKKQKIYIAVLTAVIMSLLLCVMYILLVNKSFSTDMPILEYINGSKWLKYVYIILLVVSMLSTLFSACSGAKKIFAKLYNNFLESICTTMAVVAISFVGFGNIINYTYPAIGIALFAQLVLNKMYKTPLKLQKVAK